MRLGRCLANSVGTRRRKEEDEERVSSKQSASESLSPLGGAIRLIRAHPAEQAAG